MLREDNMESEPGPSDDVMVLGAGSHNEYSVI